MKNEINYIGLEAPTTMRESVEENDLSMVTEGDLEAVATENSLPTIEPNASAQGSVNFCIEFK